MKAGGCAGRGSARAALLAAAWLAAAASLLAVAEDAGAKRGLEVFPKAFVVELRAGHVDGYRARIHGDVAGKVTVVLDGRTAISSYTAPGTVTKRRIAADFGRFGQVDLRLQGRGRRIKLPPRCRGPKPYVAIGSFRGRLSFNAERSDLALAKSRVKGFVVDAERVVCERRRRRDSRRQRRAPARKRDVPITGDSILVVQRQAGRSTVFTVSQSSAEAKGERFTFGIASAEVRQKIGRVAISHSTLVITQEGALLSDWSPSRGLSATIALDKPFSGTAHFAVKGEAPDEWLGDLAVHLPGVGRVELTGAGFSASGCHTTDVKRFLRCSARLTARLEANSGPAAGGMSERHSPARLLALAGFDRRR